MDALFWALHSGLEREGPGTPEDTRRALSLTGLSGLLRVLDAGCGPGPATLVLLDALPEAHVCAVDLHEPFIAVLKARAGDWGLDSRLEASVADMAAPPCAPGSLDLIWCEGAIYNLGVRAALEAWRPMLAHGGRVVFSELVWASAAPHPAARAFWAEEYPAMTDAAGVRARIESAGFSTLAEFPVSEAAWEAYYGPLAHRSVELAAIHGSDHPVLEDTRREIAMRQDHGSDYAYQFFVVAP